MDFDLKKKKNIPGENWNRPVFRLITEDLSEILTDAQTEAVLVCAVAKHWRANRLWEDTHGDVLLFMTHLTGAPSHNQSAHRGFLLSGCISGTILKESVFVSGEKPISDLSSMYDFSS